MYVLLRAQIFEHSIAPFSLLALPQSPTIGDMHDLYFTTGSQNPMAGRIILSGTGVLIALAVALPTRKLLVGLN